MNGQDRKLTLDRFEALLDAYGGDLSRWPGDTRGAAQSLLEASSDARALHAESRVLDHVLAKASKPDAGQLEQLAQRIVSAARAETTPEEIERRARSGDGGARVIRLPVGRGSEARPQAAGSRRSEQGVSEAAMSGARQPASRWKPLAALAASLALGVAIGMTDVASTASFDVASLIEASSSDADVMLSGLQLDGLNVLDEDQI
jgi:hypothetical protein